MAKRKSFLILLPLILLAQAGAQAAPYSAKECVDAMAFIASTPENQKGKYIAQQYMITLNYSLNAYLRGSKEPDLEQCDLVANQLTAFLKTVGAFRGTTWRGTELPQDKRDHLTSKKMKKDAPTVPETKFFSDPAFLSTSIDRNVARAFFPDASNPTKAVFFKIEGHSGRSISQFRSSFALESEVLFLPATRFEVLNVSCYKGDNQKPAVDGGESTEDLRTCPLYVEMKELAENE